MDQRLVSYRKINLLFLAVIIGVFVYSLLFSLGQHPIPSFFTDISGIVSPSKGLSAAFSQLVRGNYADAQRNNPHVLQIFSFFALQLMLRVFFLLLIRLKAKTVRCIIWVDIGVSLMLFLWCFAPFIRFTFNLFLNSF
ncbi:MAG TPA: hypothetical protein DG754_03050 [Bacteroidales bacterium]|jgi:hypothetical protein|nr:hypothetical protein [Bacteroidales bacterium]